MTAARGETADRKLIDCLGSSAEVHGQVRGLLATTFELDPDFLEVDFLPALLRLGAWEDRSWTSRVALEKELAMMEAACIVMASGRYRGRPRSLRLEVLPLSGRKQHSKLTLVVYERAVRLLVTSANLTTQGYRQNREVALQLEAREDATQDAALIVAALRDMPDNLVANLGQSGQLVRQLALDALSAWGPTQASPTQRFVWGGNEPPAWQQVVEAWPAGEAIRRLAIVSPFWSDEGSSGPLWFFLKHLRSTARLAEHAEVQLFTEGWRHPDGRWIPQLHQTFCRFPTAELGVSLTARAVSPRVLPEEVGGREDFVGARPLHAKILLAEGPRSTLVYLGSGNFTKSGWGLLRDPFATNLEAGVVIVRTGERDAVRALLPETEGDPIDLSNAGSDQLAPLEPVVGAAAWPAFITGLVLEPSAEGDVLDLVLRVRPDAESFRVETEDEPTIELFGESLDSTGSRASSLERRLTPTLELLNRLLRRQQVRVRWPAATDGANYPINVTLDARAGLPIAPGDARPGELLLLSYYQGRLTWEELFEDPDVPIDQTALAAQLADAPSGVDTSRIQSYQVRAFVEALQGLAADVRAAAVSEPAIRLALTGPISPVALAREVDRAVRDGARSPVAGGFQLVEILAQLLAARDVSVPERLRAPWAHHLTLAEAAVNERLIALRSAHPDQLGHGSLFARFERTVRAAAGGAK